MNKLRLITNNSGMESLYFLIPLFFVVILVFPISIRLKSSINVSKNLSYLAIYLYKKRLVLFKIMYRDKKLFLTTKRKKKEIDITISMNEIYFIDTFVENLKEKVQFRKVNVNSKIGTNNAMETAISCGLVSSIANIIFGYLKNKKSTYSFSNNIIPCFDKQIYLNCIYISISTTLFDLIYSLIISLFGLRRKVYEREQ